MTILGKWGLRILSCTAATALCMSTAACAGEPAPSASPENPSSTAEFANGADLQTLVPETVGLSIGGNGIVNGMGFLKNFYCITEAELAKAVKNPSLLPQELGGQDAWQENLLFSAYDNHGAPQYVYYRLSGINVDKALTALGVDTSKSIAVEAKASDGYSKILDDAFCTASKRDYYAPSREATAAVLPLLAFYESKLVVDDPAKAVELPQEAGKEAKSLPLFAFGQTAADENNNCSYVSNTVKIRVGMDSPAFILETAKGIHSISVSDLALLGRYSTTYSFNDDDVHTHEVTGVPLQVLLSHWQISLGDIASMQVFSADSQEATRTLTTEELSRSFIAFAATENGTPLENSTATRLYCPGNTKNDVVVANLTKAIIA